MVYVKFFLGWEDRFFGDKSDLGLVAADANGEIGRASATLRAFCISLFYASVLKGVECDYCEPAAGGKALYRAFYRGRDNGKL